MPIYAYRCGACGHARDVLQKLSDPVLTTCPSCGAEAFSKQVTAAGFQLKGSGWYVTDFRDGNKGSKGDKKDDKADQGDTSAKPDKPAESTPASADAKGKDGGATPAQTAAPAPATAPSPGPAPAPSGSTSSS